jgi:hypothetical protein
VREGTSKAVTDEPIIKIPIRFVLYDPKNKEKVLDSFAEQICERHDIALLDHDHPSVIYGEPQDIHFNAIFKASEIVKRSSRSSYKVLLDLIKSLRIFSSGYCMQTLKSWPSILENIHLDEEEIIGDSLGSLKIESFHWDSGFELSMGQFDKIPSESVIGISLDSRNKCIDIFHTDERCVESFGDVS